MSTTTTERPQSVENIKVLQVGKFGVRVDEKSWMGVNEPMTPQHFQVGEGYKVAVVTSKTGKKYINEIVGKEETAPAVTQGVSTVTHSQPKATESSAPSTPKLDEKSIQIQRQGLYQAALQSPVLSQFTTSFEEYLSFVRKTAEAGIAFVAER